MGNRVFRLVLIVLTALVGMWWHSHSRYVISELASPALAPAKTAAATPATPVDPANAGKTSVVDAAIKLANKEIEQPITAMKSAPKAADNNDDDEDAATPSAKPTSPANAASVGATLSQTNNNAAPAAAPEASHVDLAHMKMQRSPEPSLDTSDDGRDEDDGYSN